MNLHIQQPCHLASPGKENNGTQHILQKLNNNGEQN